MHTETLSTALSLHQRGELEQAARLYSTILAADPSHPDALQLLGLICLQRGDPHRAIELIGRAVGLMPSVAPFHANLAEAYRAARQFDLAVNCCRMALQLQPNYPEIHNTLGLIQMDQGRCAEAVPHFQTAIEQRPNFALALNNLGNAYRLLDDKERAIEYFRKSVEADPNLAMGHGNLGQMLLEDKKLSESLEHTQAAVRLQPTSAPAHNNLGNVLREMGRLAEAKAAYVEALRINPNLGMIHSNIGQCLEEEGALDDAIRWYQQAINLDPGAARYHANLGSAFREKKDTDKAVAAYQTALRCDPEYAEALAGLGWVEHEQGHFDQAKEYYREALRRKPTLAAAHCNLAQVMEELNDLPQAETHLREAVKLDPRNTGAYAQLALLLRGKLPESEMHMMRHLVTDPLLSDGKRASLLFGMAQVYDAQKEFDRAGECLHQANPLEHGWRKQRGQGWFPANHTRFVDQLIGAFTPELFERMSGWGLDSERPVFIVGLPRSGTTLLEQVLASHAQMHGAGELRFAREDFESLADSNIEADCFAALETLDRAGAQRLAQRHLDRLHTLDATAERVVDKMPDNYMYLGLLSVLFPQAKFIHCRRDLRDVAVSCWMTHFRQIGWANNRDDIAHRFREYRRIMDHWAQVLPASVLEIDYEDAVEDLEGVARRMVGWCGLEWDPACLEFHQTQRPVRTASVTQVRQPVYKRSVGRWKNYEDTLGSLFRELEALDGPALVEASGAELADAS